MKFGLTEDEFSLLMDLVINPLKKMDCQLWIFGSRAGGSHQKYSDIDLLFKPPKGKTLPPAFLAELKEREEESRLSYKVDLVNDQDLASSYRQNVEQEKILL